MTFKELFKGEKSRFFWLNILGMVGVVIVILTITLFSLDLYTHHGESVDVPQLTGMNQYQAMELLDEAGLKYEVIDSTYRKDMQPDCIVEQSPTAGNKVKKGHIIYLTINSTHSPTVSIPDIVDNCSLRQAQAQLSAMGVKVGPIELTNGEKDWVYGLKYNGRRLMAGDRIPVSATVIIVVGNGNTTATDSINNASNTTDEGNATIDDIAE